MKTPTTNTLLRAFLSKHDPTEHLKKMVMDYITQHPGLRNEEIVFFQENIKQLCFEVQADAFIFPNKAKDLLKTAVVLYSVSNPQPQEITASPIAIAEEALSRKPVGINPQLFQHKHRGKKIQGIPATQELLGDIFMRGKSLQ